MPSLASRINTFVITANHYKETDMKAFLSFPFLLDFFTLAHLLFFEGDCLCKQSCPYISFQSSSNFNTFILFYNFRAFFNTSYDLSEFLKSSKFNSFPKWFLAYLAEAIKGHLKVIDLEKK